jgi:hypothetical protein
VRAPSREKTPETHAPVFDETLSPVRFEGKTCGIATMFSDAYADVTRFLFNPDCVAESAVWR